jgi:histidinol-phosphatase (PHP family)
MIPPDNHVHSEWSWDAVAGSMERSCARAVDLGLPSIAFTEHVDLTRWLIAAEALASIRRNAATDAAVTTALARVAPDGRFDPPPLDVDGYLACLEHCRDRFPALRIRSGFELEAPHWHPEQVNALLATVTPDRVLGGLHSVNIDGDAWEAGTLFEPYAPNGMTPDRIIDMYLAETLRMVESAAPFAVLAHIDYPLRRWPAGAGTFDPTRHEDAYRAVLRALARSGRVLEVNTSVPLHAEVIRWWRKSGGDAISFGSDAHEPSKVGDSFTTAAALVESHGFRPAGDPHDFWVRRS